MPWNQRSLFINQKSPSVIELSGVNYIGKTFFGALWCPNDPEPIQLCLAGIYYQRAGIRAGIITSGLGPNSGCIQHLGLGNGGVSTTGTFQSVAKLLAKVEFSVGAVRAKPEVVDNSDCQQHRPVMPLSLCLAPMQENAGTRTGREKRKQLEDAENVA